MKNLYASILLIAATSIGAAILFFPTMLESTGFILSMGLLLLVWAVMNYVGFLFLEITLWFPPGSHFLTMGQKLLGRPMAIVSWAIYLVMMYLLLSAYLSGFISFLTNIFNYFNFPLQNIHSILFFSVLLVAVAFYFARDKANYFIVGVVFILLLFFVLFAILSVPYIHVGLLQGGSPKSVFSSISLIIIAFSYHFIIPRIRDGIEGEKFKNARRILFFGGLLLLGIYFIWLLIIFSVAPLLNNYGLLQYVHTAGFTTSIQNSMSWSPGHPWILIAQVVFFLGLTASFVTIANSFYNFSAMTFKSTRYRLNKIFLLSFIFIPPLIYTFFFPHDIVPMITLIGILVTYLYMISPALMVWIGRHSKEFSFGYRVRGGRFILMGLILLGVLLMALQFYSLIH